MKLWEGTLDHWLAMLAPGTQVFVQHVDYRKHLSEADYAEMLGRVPGALGLAVQVFMEQGQLCVRPTAGGDNLFFHSLFRETDRTLGELLPPEARDEEEEWDDETALPMNDLFGWWLTTTPEGNEWNERLKQAVAAGNMAALEELNEVGRREAEAAWRKLHPEAGVGG